MSEASSQPLSIDISFPTEGTALVELVGELEVVSVEEFSVRMADLDGGGRSHVVNGRFKGGYITRHYGRPAEGVHAVQMELACRSYLPELPSPSVTPETWPVAYDQAYAAETRAVLRRVLTSCLEFATASTGAAS